MKTIDIIYITHEYDCICRVIHLTYITRLIILKSINILKSLKITFF